MSEIEWQILEDEPLPETEESQPRARRRWPWRRILVVLALLIVAGAVGVWRWAEIQEERVRADVERALVNEERALRFGFADQLPELVDPTAPERWIERYRETFAVPAQEWSTPRLLSVEHHMDVALATFEYTFEGETWRRARAYRFVDGAWRRTPIPADWWGDLETYTSEHFTLLMAPRDAEAMPPEELLAFLEGFRADLAQQWRFANDTPLTLRIEPFDLNEYTPGWERFTATEFAMNSSLLVEPGDLSFLLPTRAYRYALGQAVGIKLAGTAQRPGQTTLLDAVVRSLLLTEEEEQQYRKLRLNERAESWSGLEEVESLSIPTLFPDYLLEAGGTAAPGRFWAKWGEEGIEAAAHSTFGRSFRSLVEESWLWIWRSAGTADLSPIPTQGDATVLAVLDEEPLRLLAAVDGGDGLVELEPASDTEISVPARCIGRGSALRYGGATEAGESLAVQRLTVRDLRLPALEYPLPPAGTQILITRLEEDGGTSIVALNGSGEETILFTLPKDADLTINPSNGSFAFLSTDACGTSVNQFLAPYNQYDRAPAYFQGESHLFWAEQLYIVDDASRQETNPHWTISNVLPGEVDMPITRRVEPDQQWGELFGLSWANERRLMAMPNGDYNWFSLVSGLDGNGIILRDANLALPEGAVVRTVSPDGRWLVYTASGEVADSVSLYVLDLEAEGGPSAHAVLHRAPKGSGYGEMVWSPDEIPTLLVATGPEVEGQIFTNALFGFNMGLVRRGAAISFQRYYLDGMVSGLHWCGNGRLLYRLTRDDVTVLAEGLTSDRGLEIQISSGISGAARSDGTNVVTSLYVPDASPITPNLARDGQVIGCVG